VETDHGKLATGRRLRSSATASVVTSGGALALGMDLTVAVMAVDPPSDGLAREATVR
jgi:hypothetical protein